MPRSVLVKQKECFQWAVAVGIKCTRWHNLYEQEISCEEKYVGRSDHPTCSGFQEQKLCCKYSHNCGDLHKCTSSFCCKADSGDETTTYISPATPSSTVPEAEFIQAPAEITQASV
ncbi:hypothetical protein SARC_06933, partial [Sphaeroforma arctica JP610]